MTVAELGRRMTYRELVDWGAYREVVCEEVRELAEREQQPINW